MAVVDGIIGPDPHSAVTGPPEGRMHFPGPFSGLSHETCSDQRGISRSDMARNLHLACLVGLALLFLCYSQEKDAQGSHSPPVLPGPRTGEEQTHTG